MRSSIPRAAVSRLSVNMAALLPRPAIARQRQQALSAVAIMCHKAIWNVASGRQFATLAIIAVAIALGAWLRLTECMGQFIFLTDCRR